MLTDLGPQQAPPRPFRLLVAGVGGAGCRAVRRLAAVRVDAVLAHTSAQALEDPGAARAVQLGAALVHGAGSGGDVTLGEQAALAEADTLRALFHGYDLVVLAAGLGGGTGSGALPVLARLARESSCLTLAVVSTPFSFEGDSRRIHAENALHRLRRAADAVVELSNDRLLPEGAAPVALSRAFALADATFSGLVPVLHGLVGRDSLLRLDFADLRRLFLHSGGAVHAAAFQLPLDRLREGFVHEVLASPQLERGQTLARARAVTAGLLAGPGLTLQDLDWAAREIRAACLGPLGQFHIGAAVDESAGPRLHLLIFTADRWADKPVATEPLAADLPPPEAAAAIPAVNAAGSPVQIEIPLASGDPHGKFADTEPNQVGGEDLDIPTFIRRGIRLRAG